MIHYYVMWVERDGCARVSGPMGEQESIDLFYQMIATARAIYRYPVQV